MSWSKSTKRSNRWDLFSLKDEIATHAKKRWMKQWILAGKNEFCGGNQI
jgi:hypothetical protein